MASAIAPSAAPVTPTGDTRSALPETVPIKSGDTISQLAARYQIPIEQLKAQNPSLFQDGTDSNGKAYATKDGGLTWEAKSVGFNGARSGLTGFVAGIARKTVKDNVTINSLLPGAFDTDRLRANIRVTAEKAGRDFEDQLAARRDLVPAGRFGDPVEFGQACAYLCSAQAGYVPARTS